MALPRIKFIWGASKALPARWFLGLFGTYERGSKRRRGLVISLRGVLGWSAVLAVAGWLAAATALHVWLGRRSYNFVTWSDCVLLPLRWDEIKRKRGQAYIAEGLDDFRARRWTEGMMKLRSGLARNPRDWPSRLKLARFFVAAELRNQALATLTDGLAHGYPGRTYLETALAIALQGEDYDQALAICERALAMIRDSRDDTRDEAWLVQQRLQVLLAAGRPEDVLGDPALRELADNALNELAVMAHLAAKQPAEAGELLQRWRKRDGGTSQIVRLQVRAFREAGDLTAMERGLEELRELSPADPKPYVYAVVQRSLAGDATGAQAALESFLRRFSSRADALQMLAAPLGEIGDVDLLRRCAEAAAGHGYPARPYQVLLVQGYLVRGDWSQAAMTFETILTDGSAKLGPVDEFWNELMQRLMPATTSAADGTQRALIEFCRDRPLPLRLTKLLHDVLMRAGRYATARDIAGFAQRLYPGSKALADAHAAADEQQRMAALAVGAARDAQLTALAAAQASLAGAEPASETARSASTLGESETRFFPAMERMTAEERWPEIVAEVRDVRRLRPAWLIARETDVRRFEMKALAGLDRALELIAVMRFFLDGSNARNLEAMAVVRQLDTTGHRDTAALVLAEILKKSPHFAPALRLRSEWEPAAAKAEEPAGADR